MTEACWQLQTKTVPESLGQATIAYKLGTRGHVAPRLQKEATKTFDRPSTPTPQPVREMWTPCYE